MLRLILHSQSRPLRAIALLAASAGFGILYFAASLFTGDYGFAGLTDDAVRTVAHFSVYGLLAAILARAIGRRHLLAWLIAALLATSEEIHQLFVPYRFACVGDWTTNMLGITAFLIASHHQSAIRRRAIGAIRLLGEWLSPPAHPAP